MIEVKNICKSYNVIQKGEGFRGALKGLISRESEKVQAVKNLSFHIQPGEIVGFIGPNGAGKSTTIKMMSGILTPSSGEILINGRDIHKYRKQVVQDIGVVFGQRSQLDWDLRLGESFELLRHIYRIDKAKYEETLNIMDQILEIKPLLSKPVRQMSLGQRVKGDLVAAMLHAPSVLFLDEPTIGLDVGAKYSLRKFVKEVNEERNTTVILTTHDLGDIEQLCDRIIIINNGELIEDGNLEEIVDRIAPYKTLVVEYYDEKAPEHARCELFFHEANVAKYRFMKKDITAAALIQALSAEAQIKDVSIEEAGIDDIIRIAYGQLKE
ncbi:MAG: ATP-binding cassette domain-containing protein [Lachnospiraceae bacterium]|nr:ATP-binding cassette domain-containing protein [Lachnospiraceae bacterium]